MTATIGEIFGLKRLYLRYMLGVKGRLIPPSQLPDGGKEMVKYLRGLPEQDLSEWMEWFMVRLGERVGTTPTNWRDRLTSEQVKIVEDTERELNISFHSWLPHGVPDNVKGFGDYKKRKNLSVESAKMAVESWLRRGFPYQVVLAGSTGSGKSHLLEAAAGELIAQGELVLFRSEGKLNNEWHSATVGHTVEALSYALQEVPWLIIDDMGTAPWGDAGRALMDTIYDNRWRKGLKTLVATNSKASDLSPRIASRLGDVQKGIVVNMTAADYRLHPE